MGNICAPPKSKTEASNDNEKVQIHKGPVPDKMRGIPSSNYEKFETLSNEDKTEQM